LSRIEGNFEASVVVELAGNAASKIAGMDSGVGSYARER
jgi:hypothetical protein